MLPVLYGDKTYRINVLINGEAAPLLGCPPKKVGSVILSVLEQHASIAKGHHPSVCKHSPETTVTLVKIEQGPMVCVKEYHWRGLAHAAKSLLRPSHGTRTFFNGLRLREKGIDVARPLALIQRSFLGLPQTEWVVMEVIPRALELDRYLLSRRDEGFSLDHKRDIVRVFGEFIGRLHLEGIFHSDLKTCNILVADPAPDGHTAEQLMRVIPHESRTENLLRIVPIDYDDVSFSGSISERQRIKNFVQLFLSTPLFITLSDRLRFLSAYGSVLGLSKAELRRITRKVVGKTWGKTILYVSPKGDVVEKWTRVKSRAKK